MSEEYYQKTVQPEAAATQRRDEGLAYTEDVFVHLLHQHRDGPEELLDLLRGLNKNARDVVMTMQQSRARAIVVTKLHEAALWLAQCHLSPTRDGEET